MTKKTSKSSVDPALREALLKAISQEGYVPLASSPKSADGLFANRKPPNKKAIEVCLDPARPLLTLKKVEESPEGGPKKPEFVQINEKGIAKLVQLSPVQTFPELISTASGVFRGRVLNSCLRAIVRRSNEPSSSPIGTAIRACFDAAQAHLDELTARLNEIVDSQREIAEVVLNFTRSTAATFAKQSKRLSDEGNLLAEARAQLVAPAPDDTPTSTRRDIGWERLQIGRANESDAAIDFQRSLSQELVFAWQDATNPEARAVLERALFNVGVEQVGEPGAQVAFDGSMHRTEDDLIPGEPAEIVDPAWQFVSKRGTLLIAPARVRKPSSAIAETQHADEDLAAVPDDGAVSDAEH